MARYAPGHKQQTRERILQSAGRLLRTRGYAQSGVAQLMGASDLTVGGFYAHFASKEALFGEVLQRSLTDLSSLLLAGLEDVKGVPFVREVARRYLSRAHRDATEHGCALPALLSEVSRQSDETRTAFEGFLLGLLEAIEPHMHESPKLTRADRAIALAALLVGGITFARAVKDKELSDRILLACKRFAVAEDEP
jgi:TetR/AcrR family transcriptional repressor of nem operon